ncbi:hypothetical protein [Williamsia herbipolensis]|uniref:hypothetical protein n=1 Tax=Williamsia herbipolensis TaxID=1603258 RepID=UPI000AB6CDC7|nr:hypothetical protein [Williamsia herbipolensis]
MTTRDTPEVIQLSCGLSAVILTHADLGRRKPRQKKPPPPPPLTYDGDSEEPW